MPLAELREWKCKTCGEPLDLGRASDGVIKCAVCDSCFTLPKMSADQKVLSFLMQGEHDLDTAKFEEAYAAFSKAAELDKTEPEAYWGMALAEFKIQYLKDEVNNRLQPICHEVSDKDFADSANFLKALRYATEAQRAEYERKSEEINYIKDEFFKIAQSGVKYDCFICVKVTDENGGRTQDYKYADDIYFELKGKGYKPFFSERELVGVTGADYEARILYALKSAECMLVVCFDEAYLRTKWVKNEYTRFLKLVNDEEKESDSIALVFGDKPIERLPNRHGKIQGVDIRSLNAIERIISFVENHTPEAKKRREEQAKQKSAEEELQRKKFLEQEERLKQQEERFKQLEAMLKAQQSQTAVAQSASAPALSDEDLLERMERARHERERKAKEEAERKVEEEAERIEREVAERLKREEKERIALDFEIENGVLKKYKGSGGEVEIPDGVKSIGSKAFKGQTLNDITISSSVKCICKDAFAECEGLKTVYYNGDILSWCNIVGLDNLMIPDGCVCERILFISGNKIEGDLVIPNGLTSIGKYAFANCDAIKNITIPESVKSIEEGAFFGCYNITDLALPNSVTRIGVVAFEYCRGLLSVSIPDSVTDIGRYAFHGCDKLNNVVLPNFLQSIGEYAFSNCDNLKNIIIPAGLTEFVDWFDWNTIESVTVDEKNQKYKTESNCVLTKDGKILIAGCKNSVIPESVTSIDGSAFVGCDSLASIIIPNGVTEIDDGAFEGCDGLKEITIPKRFEKRLSEIFSYVDLTGCTINFTLSEEEKREEERKAKGREG